MTFKINNAKVFINGVQFGDVKNLSIRESDAVHVDAIREAFEQRRYIYWRGYQGILVEMQERVQPDGTWKITKLEGAFHSPVTDEPVRVPVPPDEVRLGP